MMVGQNQTQMDITANRLKESRKSVAMGINILADELNGTNSLYVKKSKQARSARKIIKQRNDWEKRSQSVDMGNGGQKGRHMNVHKKQVNLDDVEKNDILKKYLTMKNKLSFQYFKSEVEGMEQEKDNARLIIQDMKKQKIYDTEEKTIMNMQNNEFRRKIQKMEEETNIVRDKRTRIQYDIDNVLEGLFKVNESYKLYNKTLEELGQANTSEVTYII